MAQHSEITEAILDIPFSEWERVNAKQTHAAIKSPEGHLGICTLKTLRSDYALVNE